ncbi:MAG: 1-acyl-sn-glycerol-3-phosphate acyltransferase [Sphingobacteriia bacterium]|nr:1-acyl-sn-glycerol-3-phosphate acyltransferase [Sphingobacteriia bacterium]
MIRRLVCFLLKNTGWTIDEQLPPAIKKCIVIAAPHTSNWDLYYMMAAFSVYRLKIRFTIKKEWMRFPFSLLLRPLGGIAIDRSPRKDGNRPSFVEAMTELFNNHEALIIAITPEGTRSRNDQWKTGFFHIARAANVPIVLGYIDYKRKQAGIGKMIYPVTLEQTMEEMNAFYTTITPRYPEKFSPDLSYKA